MKKKESGIDIVFQIIKKCDQGCPHCFFDSSLLRKEKLTLLQIKKGLQDLKTAGISKINKFIFTGGEPTLHSGLPAMIKAIGGSFPEAKIRIDTNGLNLFEKPSLFKKLDAGIYNISIDPFHNQGLIKKEEKFKDIFIKKDGSSPLLDFFLKQKEKHKFELDVRWTSSREDAEWFEKFFERYKNEDIAITKKFVTATGRAELLPDRMKSSGYLIKENPKNFQCLIGISIILAIDGYWYGCYHPVPFTRLSRAGQSVKFKNRSGKLMGSDIAEKLPGIGIVKTLEIIKKERPESAPAIDEVLKTRYWYRCQPCEDCCKKNIFKL